MKKLILSLVLLNLLTACAGNKPKETASEPAAAETAAAAPAETAAVTAAPTATAANAVVDAIPEARSAYFPFDVDSVQSADRDMIRAHGIYLSNNKDAKVRVEGNCDERGSSEYNLGLGQRRADNVKKALVLAGARASQIETVSFGEEKPRASGHDESSWAQNRRADIVYAR